MATKTKPKTQEEQARYFCNACGKTLGDRAFYSTDNPKYSASNGKLPFCKSCIKDSFIKSFRDTSNIKQSIIATAMRFDIPYSENNIPSFEERELVTPEEALVVFYEFIKMSNSLGKQMLAKKGFDYELWVQKVLTINKIELSDDEKMFLSEGDFGIEVGQEEIKFFGEGYSRKDYIFLTKSFLALAENFDIPNSIVANIYKDLCFLELRIDKAKRLGTSEKEIMSMLEGKRKLIKDAGISIYEKKGDEKIEGFGKMVKRLEMTRPAADPLPEWDDNKLKRLSDTIAGHILMAEGYENKVVEDYKKAVEPYSIDPDNLWGEDDDE